MTIPEGKTVYYGKRVFKPGSIVPPDLEATIKSNLDHIPPPPPPDPEPEV